MRKVETVEEIVGLGVAQLERLQAEPRLDQIETAMRALGRRLVVTSDAA